ncbi:hypothetical protein SODALDRAFT_104787 [Sodiomyces alkalinus F11]|uniref:Kelch repeat protein n=1 Tax=Sodiomyces alkalinus (strain CBS 110278 / VKM F-3762 / F11) TaxID=1314773 RepID=A0A3N2Q1Y9_SODAK|nr:hypothetical protein SODALDRAFT_104787 [Sodiomyces alkalinus F11]ROT40770.1 hypothetical protein SODALDRAFT_104787 [Sodiomyces alkalinus F11]
MPCITAGVIRDTVYLDGGYIYWSQGLSNGEYGPIDQPNNPLGLMYTLNFSQPFNLSQNLTALFGTISKARGGAGNANSDAPNYLDGAMLVNDAQLALYGGLVKKTDAFDPPREDEVLVYQQYYYNRQERGSWNPGFNTDRLPEDLTRYIAFGGAASAPSENKAWYFGGLRAPNWGPIFQRTSNITENAVNVSSTLITLDMRDQLDLEWTNTTLPDEIKGRANPEVVWVPVGEEGILVVIGGVTYPDWITTSRVSENAAQSTEESDEFMAVIDIYDVASGRWYRQRTVEGPTARTRGCAVVAPAQDSSSFNIYYYGGYPGVDPRADFYDDVWVLSIPSFTWTRVSEGRPNHGRAGHKCFMPYPDQMMVIGGDTPRPGSNLACLDGGIIQIFNLTSAEWMDEYHPERYFDYGVPSAVRAVIGGQATGGAALTTPSPSGWRDDELADIFDTPYETSKIQTWYPYAAVTESSRPTIPDNNDDENENEDEDEDDSGGGGGGGGLPGWVAPTLGVVLGLVFVTAALVAFCLWRKRKFLKQRGDSEASPDENGMRVLSWIRGQPSETKALTVTTEETPSNLDMTEVSSSVGPIASPAFVTAAVPSRFEMMDTSIAELPGTIHPLLPLPLFGDNQISLCMCDANVRLEKTHLVLPSSRTQVSPRWRSSIGTLTLPQAANPQHQETSPTSAPSPATKPPHFPGPRGRWKWIRAATHLR